MIKEIVTDVSVLSKRSIEWDVKKNQDLSIELVQNLCDTLEADGDRLFLTASQIGYNERAFAMKFAGETEVFMNPAIQARDKVVLMREYDVATGKEFIVPRFSSISLVFQDCLGKIRGLKFNEGASVLLCRVLDLLDGVFASDYGLEVLPEFDVASDEERAELLAEYTKSLSELYNAFDDELCEDEEISKTWNQAKFVRAVADGDVKFEDKPLSNRKRKRLKKLEKLMKGIKVKWKN